MGGGGRRHRALVVLLGFVVEGHRDLNGADAVGKRVMHLAQQRCPSVGQSVDQRHLPQRAGSVEVCHRREPRHFEEGVDGAGPGGSHSAQVEGEVEVGIELPAGRGGGRRRHHPLPERRHPSAERLEAVDQLVPVRGPVEQNQGDDC